MSDADLWPVFEFRPHADYIGSILLRYAEGKWIPDDGEWDIAFVSYGMGAPYGLGVYLPYQRNIIWSGLTSHWRGEDRDHPCGNPWHYMLREGETEWGGAWDRDRHPNERAQREAMNKCCSMNGCANGRGPNFEAGDKHILAGLVRDRESKRVVTPPEKLTCMFCGDAWAAKAAVREAA